MKKILISILLVLLPIISVYSNKWYHLYEINIKPVDCEWTGWIKCTPDSIDMNFDDKTKQFVILSQTIQTFCYTTLYKEETDDYYLIYAIPSDSFGRKVGIKFYFYNNGDKILEIIYQDGEYMYKVK